MCFKIKSDVFMKQQRTHDLTKILDFHVARPGFYSTKSNPANTSEISSFVMPK